MLREIAFVLHATRAVRRMVGGVAPSQGEGTGAPASGGPVQDRNDRAASPFEPEHPFLELWEADGGADRGDGI
jgi:hypothetical protein